MSIACPTRDDLAAYALGKLPRERCEEIDMHLEQCTDCQAELETCGNADDTFLSRLREPESSDEFLDEAECAEVMARVAAIGREPSFTTQRQIDEAAEAAPDLGNVGPYRLLAKLGAGGMGTVYKAFHTKLKRVVALKMLPAERRQEGQSVAQIEREMEAGGKLVHPNIVLAHDAGEHDGKHFLVMEHVEGIDLSDLVHRHGPLPIAAACEIIRQAAVGLQHAHEHGLVHRDIKPSNLMLTNDGSVKILDMGLALLPETGNRESELTGTGQAMGTLDYMAPEQGGDSHTVDIRADLYALGATLYKLLAGRAPFANEKYEAAINKLMALATETPTSLHEIRDDVPGELSDFVACLLAKTPDERPATPSEVAAALEQFAVGCDLRALLAAVDQQPSEAKKRSKSTDEHVSSPMTRTTTSPPKPGVARVPAKPLAPTAALRAKRAPLMEFLRRYARPITIGAILAGIVALGVMVIRLTGRDGELVIETDDPNIRVSVKQGDDEVAVADAESGWTIKLKSGEYQLDLGGSRDRFDIDRDTITVHRGDQVRVKITLKRARDTASTAEQVVPSPAQGQPRETTEPVSHTALVSNPARLPGLKSWTIETRAPRGQVHNVAFGPDGKLLASAGDDGTIRVWEPKSMRLVRTLLGHHGPIQNLAWSPDGTTLASTGDDRTVRLWQPACGTATQVLEGADDYLQRIAWAPSGQALAATGHQVAWVWDVGSGEMLCGFAGHSEMIHDLAWSPDSRHVATASWDETCAIWDARSGAIQHRLEGHNDRVLGVAWSPDGKLLASIGHDRTVRLWETATGRPGQVFELPQHSSVVSWSPGGDMVACAVNDMVVGWDVNTGEQRLAVNVRGRSRIQWSADGRRVGCCSADGNGHVSLVVVDLHTQEEILPRRGGLNWGSSAEYFYCEPDWSADFTSAAGFGGKLMKVIDINSNRTLQTLSLHPTLTDPSYFAEKTAVAAVRAPVFGAALPVVFRGDTEEVFHALPRSKNALHHPKRVDVAALSPDGKRIFLSNKSGYAAIWDVAEREAPILLEQLAPSHKPAQAAWSPDGTRLLITIDRRREDDVPAVFVIDPDTGDTELAQAEPMIQRCPFWFPDGRRIGYLVFGRNAVIRDVETGDEEARVSGGHAFALSRNAARLTYLGPEVSLKTYDTQSWELLKSGDVPPGYQSFVAWTADGRQLVTLGRACELAFTDFVTGRVVRRLPVPGSTGVLSADRKTLVVSESNSLRLIDFESGRQLGVLMAIYEKNAMMISPEGYYRATANTEPALVYGKVEDAIVYVAQTESGEQITLTPEEFKQEYGWRNDPKCVQVLAKTESKTPSDQD